LIETISSSGSLKILNQAQIKVDEKWRSTFPIKIQHANEKGDFVNGTGIVNYEKEIQLMFTLIISTGKIMVMWKIKDNAGLEDC
jgi:hypothetical protein